MSPLDFSPIVSTPEGVPQLVKGLANHRTRRVVQEVKGLIHYERRLHQLMLKEEEKDWLKDKEKYTAQLEMQQAAAEVQLAAAQEAAAQHAASQQAAFKGAMSRATSAGRATSPLPFPLGPGTKQLGVAAEPAFATVANGAATPPTSSSPRASLPPSASRARSLGTSSAADDSLLAAFGTPPTDAWPLVHMVTSPAEGSEGDSPTDTSSDAGGSPPASLVAYVGSRKYSRPEVTIQHYGHLNYWLVAISCKDRNKLFFDTVCTLSDLNYDIYHGEWHGLETDVARVRAS